MNVTLSYDFAAVQDAIQSARRTFRADARMAAASPEEILWHAHTERVRDHSHRLAGDDANARGRADAMVDGHVTRMARIWSDANYDVRADSSSFFANDLTDRSMRLVVRPQVPLALIGAIPTRRIQPWAEAWTNKYVSDSGVAVPWKPGSTDTVVVNHSVDEALHPTIMFRADAATFIGDAERAAMSGVDAGSPEQDTRRALMAHNRAHNSLLAGGIAGFPGYSLLTLPGVLRITGSNTWGTGGTASTTVIPEFKSILEKIPVTSDQAMPSPDTMLISQRLWNALGSYFTDTGGMVFSMRAVEELITGYGITQVTICPELHNFSATGREGLVLFNRNSEDSLRQVVGLMPSPVKSFDHDLGRRTAFLSGAGGLTAPLAGSVLIFTTAVA